LSIPTSTSGHLNKKWGVFDIENTPENSRRVTASLPFRS
jgi:hypothetical protein